LTNKRIVVIGAGGMAREIRWLISDINVVSPQYEFAGYVVSDLNAIGPHDSREDIVGDYAWLDKNRGSINALAIGIGNPAARLKVAQQLNALIPDAEFPVLIHPTVVLDRAGATLEEGVLVCAGVVATVNIKLRAFALCNFACTLGHEATIGRGSVINPGANISGGVTIGDGALVGTGARVLQYLSVGEGATVGAGAVVTQNVPPGVTVVGIPAKILRNTGK
jgi:sugar O-acyltransferase (sialic acid O-acetyltransferase NeuD family)